MRNAGESLQIYETPWHIFHGLESDPRIRRFAADVAASADNAKCPVFITEEEDALFADWPSPAFCNPPYEAQRHWLVKAAWEASRGVRSCSLIKVATSELYWLPLTYEIGTTDYFHGRIAFIDPRTKKPRAGADFASAAVFMGPGIPSRVDRYRCAKTGLLVDELRSVA